MSRIVIAAEHTLVRQAVAALLKEAGFKIVGEEACGEQAATLCQKLQPDLILLDLAGMNALSLIPLLLARAPKTKILTLSDDAGCIFEAMEPHGCVAKREPPEELIKAIRRTLSGKRSSKKRPSLTPREQQILRLIACGKTSAQISQFLKISPKTVETHRTHLMKKLDIHTTAGLTYYALARGLVHP